MLTGLSAVEARQALASSPGLLAAQDDIDDSSSAATSGNTFATYRSRVTSALDSLETIERNIKRLSIISKYIDAAIPHLQVIRFMVRDQTLAEFETFIRNIIQYRFTKLTESGFLFERLIATLVLRRARFNYLRARSNRFGVARQPSSEAAATAGSYRIQALDTVTALHSIPETRPATMIGSTATMISRYPSARVSLPKPPAAAYDATHVRCPCCLQVVSADANAWRSVTFPDETHRER